MNQSQGQISQSFLRAQYPNQWVALNKDMTKIIAAARDMDTVVKDVEAQGIKVSDVAFSFIEGPGSIYQ